MLYSVTVTAASGDDIELKAFAMKAAAMAFIRDGLQKWAKQRQPGGVLNLIHKKARPGQVKRTTYRLCECGLCIVPVSAVRSPE